MNPRSLLFVALLPLATTCTSSQLHIYPSLVECPSRKSRGVAAASLPAGVLEKALGAASEWAKTECYLPCEYQMCGSVTSYGEGRITVHLTTTLFSDRGEFAVVPEAEVVLDEKTLKPVAHTFWHSACPLALNHCSRRSEHGASPN